MRNVFSFPMMIPVTGSFNDTSFTFVQAALTSATSELQTVKDSQLHQKKRINEMLVSLLKDLNEVGTIIGTSNDAMKVKL